MCMTARPRPVPDDDAQMRLDDDGGSPVSDPLAEESAPLPQGMRRGPAEPVGLPGGSK
jgi:hypothetical protein